MRKDVRTHFLLAHPSRSAYLQRRKHLEMKFTIELVPNPLWGKNLAKLLSREDWEWLRTNTIEKYRNRCGICGAGGTMFCHEIWHYDDENHIQHLTGLIALCELCHQCKHLGRTIELAKQKKVDWAAVFNHFCRVNGVSGAGFANARIEAFRQWRERNKYEWTQDFGEYGKLLHR